MSEPEVKKILDHFLGIRDDLPAEEIKPVLREWEKMREEKKLSPERKKKGWEEIQARRAKMSQEEEGDLKEEKPGRVIRPAPNIWQKSYFPGRLAAGVAAVFVAAISFFLWNRDLENGSPYSVALIMAPDADVRVGGKPVGDGQRIKTGDWIENSKGSYRLVIEDQLALDVQYKSRLRIVTSKEKTVIELKDGGVAAVVQKKNRTRPLVFQTPTGDVSVKGTVFYLRVMSDDESYFCLCHGIVELITQDERKVVRAAHHGGYSMVRENGTEKIKADTMLYHQDPLLEEMAEALHYEIDWSAEP